MEEKTTKEIAEIPTTSDRDIRQKSGKKQKTEAIRDTVAERERERERGGKRQKKDTRLQRGKRHETEETR
jgi:hypothetical protein